MPLPQMHTIAEVIDALKVSRQTVRLLIDNGELPAVKVGGQYRVTDDALAAYLERSRVAVRPAARAV